MVMNPRSVAVTSLVFILFFLGLGVSPQVAYAHGKKNAPQKSAPPASPNAKAQKNTPPRPTTAPSTTQSGEREQNDPDMPAFLRGKIDEQTYLRLRAEYIARIRGIDLHHPPDPHLRMNAIRTMEQQEQRLYGHKPLSRAPGASGSIVPLTSPVWTELGPNPFPNAQVQSGSE